MKRPLQKHHGFTLVEVTLALGVAAFSLVAIFGLLPVGMNTSQAAIEQSSANNILSAVLSDLRSTPATVPPGGAVNSAQYNIPIPANPVTASPAATTVYFTADGAYTTALTAASHFRLTVTFLPNGTATRAPTLAKLAVSWPASVATGSQTSSAEQFSVLDRN